MSSLCRLAGMFRENDISVRKELIGNVYKLHFPRGNEMCNIVVNAGKACTKFIILFKIASNDTLPSHICFECFGHLSNFHKFRQNCMNSDVFLREQVYSFAIILLSLYARFCS